MLKNLEQAIDKLQLGSAGPPGSKGIVVIVLDRAEIKVPMGPLKNITGGALGSQKDYQGTSGTDMVQGIELALAELSKVDDAAQGADRRRRRQRHEQRRREGPARAAQEAGRKRELEEEWEAGESRRAPLIGEEEIADIVSMWTGIPVFKLTEAETQKLMRMEDELHKRVIGQHPAIEVISKAIRRSRAGLKDPKRPTGSFIFLGPSGVGKTELARTLAEFLFGDYVRWSASTCPSTWEKHAVCGWSARPPATSATTRAASSPRPCAASPTACCCWTRSRRPTPTC